MPEKQKTKYIDVEEGMKTVKKIMKDNPKTMELLGEPRKQNMESSKDSMPRKPKGLQGTCLTKKEKEEIRFRVYLFGTKPDNIPTNSEIVEQTISLTEKAIMKKADPKEKNREIMLKFLLYSNTPINRDSTKNEKEVALMTVEGFLEDIDFYDKNKK